MLSIELIDFNWLERQNIQIHCELKKSNNVPKDLHVTLHSKKGQQFNRQNFIKGAKFEIAIVPKNAIKLINHNH